MFLIKKKKKKKVRFNMNEPKIKKGEQVLITDDLSLLKNDFQKEWAGKRMTVKDVYNDKTTCSILNESYYFKMEEDATSDYAGSLWTEKQLTKIK